MPRKRTRPAGGGSRSTDRRVLLWSRGRCCPAAVLVRRPLPPVEVPAKAGPRKGAVDDVVDPGLELAERVLGLSLGQKAVLDRLVEVFLHAVDDRLLQAVHGFVLRLGDVRQRLAVPELLEELRDGQAEIVARGGEVVVAAERRVAEIAEAMWAARAEAVRAAEEERYFALLDPRLHRVGLRL